MGNLRAPGESTGTNYIADAARDGCFERTAVPYSTGTRARVLMITAQARPGAHPPGLARAPSGSRHAPFRQARNRGPSRYVWPNRQFKDGHAVQVEGIVLYFGHRSVRAEVPLLAHNLF